MAGTPTIYTGEDASVWISGLSHSTLAISDFSLTLGADLAEQPLIGSKGNFSMRGAMSADGSLTSCRLHSTAVSAIVKNMIDGEHVWVSGNCGANSLYFYFVSTQITGFNFTLGTASDIAEGALDFSVLYPYKISGIRLSEPAGKSYITDAGH